MPAFEFYMQAILKIFFQTGQLTLAFFTIVIQAYGKDVENGFIRDKKYDRRLYKKPGIKGRFF
ncbi:hypothetical protein NCCP133_09400 [Cytobacillus sp. NCCP-133]|nr:hypothetical protein NCCP133_09400 [Cytobacillus sp. NCCP-133]